MPPPVYLASDFWRNPSTGGKRAVLVLGVDPADPVFRMPEIQQKLALLSVPEFVLIDQKSRREFGPNDGYRFGDADIGVESELGQHTVRIAGHFMLGMGFVADGAVLTSIRGFQRIRPHQAPNDVSLGLIKLKPGADPDGRRRRPEAAAFRRCRSPDAGQSAEAGSNALGLGDVDRADLSIGRRGGVVVGTAIVYQVLSSDVANHLPEYATLKAMGYSGNYLASVVLQQAVALAVLGFLPAWPFRPASTC